MVLPVTLITGASSGLGHSLTKLFSSENHMVLAISRTVTKVKEFQNNKNIICSSLDLSLEKDILEIKSILGIKYKVKHLINCSAMLNIKENLIDYSYQDLEYMFKLNTIAPVFMVSNLAKNNCFLDRARVLNIGSKAAHVPIRKMYGYCLTKSALYMSYMCFKKELKQKGIFLGSMMPGVMNTGMVAEMKERGVDPEEKGMLEPDTVANFIKFLLSNQISDEKFSEEEWDIFNRSHHSQWNLKNEHIPLDASKLNYK